jgi:hypothetical protein
MKKPKSKKDILDDLNMNQMKRLRESLKQAEKGELINHNEMREKIKVLLINESTLAKD